MQDKNIPDRVDVVICGAGIAGISTAYQLAVVHGLENVVLIDERPPLTLTSDKSTECYRNWWPGPGDAMVRLMNRSIEIMEQLAHRTNNAFALNRRGYLYATAAEEMIENFKAAGLEAAEMGAGPMRIHEPNNSSYQPHESEGFETSLDGCDLILDKALIREHFPDLSSNVVAVLHVRRCGFLSAQQLGMVMLEQAKAHGLRLIRARVEDVVIDNGSVVGVKVSTRESSQIISSRKFVNAAGPMLKQVAQLMNIELPVFNELHYKISFEDTLGVLPRDVPMLIWMDPTTLPWSDEERTLLNESDERRWLLEPLPSGVHVRPEGGFDSQTVLVIWSYHTDHVEPKFPIYFDDEHYEIALRGLSVMLPELARYFYRLPKPVLDGGYYTKTRENRPLIGQLPVEGAYIIGALSGFGIMSSCAAGELLAAHITGAELPPYAAAFSLERYQDPEYQNLLSNWGSTGQL